MLIRNCYKVYFGDLYALVMILVYLSISRFFSLYFSPLYMYPTS